MTKLVWEEEHILLKLIDPRQDGFSTEHHLKVLIPRPDHPRPYKISVAWVRREDKRKYEASVIADRTHDEVRYTRHTFRSLKSAKAWCLAIYTMEN